MKQPIAQGVMTLAAASLGAHRREWASAMEAEFRVAVETGQPLRFALGCLATALRAAPAHDEGRFTLASHILAVGVILPIGILLLSSVIYGFPFLTLGDGGTTSLLGTGTPSFFISDGNATGLPLMALLTVALGIGHVGIAWLVLERDWVRVATLGSLGGATLLTILTFSSIFFLFDASALPQAAVIAGELAAVWSLARWHDDLPAQGIDAFQISST